MAPELDIMLQPHDFVSRPTISEVFIHQKIIKSFALSHV